MHFFAMFQLLFAFTFLCLFRFALFGGRSMMMPEEKKVTETGSGAAD